MDRVKIAQELLVVAKDLMAAKKADAAIRESAKRNRTVTIPCDRYMENYDVLSDQSEDWKKRGRSILFYGEDDKGNEFSVALQIPDWDDAFECPRCGTELSPEDVEYATWGNSCPKCGYKPHPAFEALEIM